MLSGNELRQAACVGKDPTLFDYPQRADRNITSADYEAASAICLECPIKAACVAEGIEMGDWSVRGGVLMRDGELPDSEGRPAKTSSAERRSNRKETVEEYLARFRGMPCVNGHERTAENTYCFKARGLPAYRCLPCKRESVANHDRRRSEKSPPVKPTGECRAGHIRVESNVFWQTDHWSCRTCRLDNQRKRRASIKRKLWQ